MEKATILKDLSQTDASDLHEVVVAASLASYQHAGQEAIVGSNLSATNGRPTPDLVVPGLRRIEEVETEVSFDKLPDEDIRKRLRPGMEVWYLVPVTRVGDAHARLRGIVDRIQPWWIDGGHVKFGNARIP